MEVGLAWKEPIGCSELSPMTPHKAPLQENRKWAGLGRSPSNNHEPLTNLSGSMFGDQVMHLYVIYHAPFWLTGMNSKSLGQ